ncbi:flagellar biosynthesis regulator FlaF [Methyloraptor flagellatus]|jgi:flagellar protein FlaF|uniref:Flagellar biosynthesis regulator FlaF n=1 Tax=Methyloraptor flagellatus TaxID=3162530 RepID=A0AAU7XFA2_9HYPH
MHNQAAAKAYQRTTQTTVNPRELEASLLLKAAAKLQAATDNWDPAGLEFDHAITYNRKLWTLLSASVTNPENPLPVQIKQNIGNLAVFVISRSVDILISPEVKKLAALININRMIAEGLRG